ncbi:MAG: hypothetical protein LRY46_03200 [Candidatus Pacebacteria bacterium]|nr:hypothetical protein [Candidatus Paceibacterota bacterium]MCD8563832.1 hypothetical protein [Candidatus Paceibacterota bacterium]
MNTHELPSTPFYYGNQTRTIPEIIKKRSPLSSLCITAGRLFLSIKSNIAFFLEKKSNKEISFKVPKNALSALKHREEFAQKGVIITEEGDTAIVSCKPDYITKFNLKKKK